MMLPKKVPVKDQEFYRQYQADHPMCEYTGCSKAAWLGPHHIIFKSKIRLDTWENLIALCQEHHDLAHGNDSREVRIELQELKIKLKKEMENADT